METINKNYILYKEPISLDTLYIVQFLHVHKIILLPTHIIERNHGVAELPSILYNDKLYSGLSEVIKFYENASGLDDLLTKSHQWKDKNPNYRINL
jgi:hypothetical protein